MPKRFTILGGSFEILVEYPRARRTEVVVVMPRRIAHERVQRFALFLIRAALERARGLGHFQSRLLGEHPQRVYKLDILDLHQERYRIAAFLTAETMEKLLSLIDGEGRLRFVMKRTARPMRVPFFLDADVTRYQRDDIRFVENFGNEIGKISVHKLPLPTGTAYSRGVTALTSFPVRLSFQTHGRRTCPTWSI